MTTRKLTYTALLTAVALAVYALESTLPPLLSFAPGARLGLSTAVCVLAVFLIGVRGAFTVLLCKCVLGALVTGNPGAMLYSVPAGVLSLLVQTVLIKLLFKHISLTAVSVTGAIVHNAVQLGVAGLITGVNLYAALPLFLVASVLSGVFTGLLVYVLLRYLPKKTYILPAPTGQNT